MSFRGQLIKLGFNTNGVDNALWQSAARYAVGANVQSGVKLYLGGDSIATGIKFGGTYTTAAIQIGTSGSKLALAAADDHAIDIHTSHALGTDGTLQCVDIEHTQTGASTQLKIEALKVGIASSVMTGDWVNAVYAVITYTAPGTAGGGMAASVCAELTLPSQTLGGGVYTLFHGYLSLGAGTVLEGGTTHVVSFLRLEAGGTVGSFNDYGFLFHVVGLTAAAADLVSANTQTLKVLVDSAGTPATRYMVLSQTQDSLKLAGAVVSAAIDLGSITASAYSNIILGGSGRISTSTDAGTALDIGATCTRSQGMYLRYSVSDWTGKSNFFAAYFRAETGASAAGYELNGIEVYGTAGHACGQLRAIQSYAYVKTGSTSVTIGPIYAISAELTFDAGSGTKTITTEAMPLRVRITGGKVDTYTKIHGIQLKSGDMNGASQTYGHAIHILDDAGMTGTITWTTGLFIPQGCTTGISLTGACATGISMTGTYSTGAIKIDTTTSTASLTMMTLDTEYNGTTGWHRGAEFKLRYKPDSDAGDSALIALSGICFLGTGSVTGDGSATGVFGQLHMYTGYTQDGTTNISRALCGVITSAGTPVLTSGGLAILHLQNNMTIDAKTGTGIRTFIFADNDFAGGQDPSYGLKSIMKIHGGATPYFWNMPTEYNSGIVSGGGTTDLKHSGTIYKIKCAMGATAAEVVYLLASTAPDTHT